MVTFCLGFSILLTINTVASAVGPVSMLFVTFVLGIPPSAVPFVPSLSFTLVPEVLASLLVVVRSPQTVMVSSILISLVSLVTRQIIGFFPF